MSGVSTFRPSWSTPWYKIVFAVIRTIRRNRMIIYCEAKQSIISRIAGKIYLLKWPSVVLNLQVRRNNMYLEQQNKTRVKLFRGYHSHFTSNSRPYTEYGCSVNVQALMVFTPKWRKIQASSTLIIVLICLCILETLTCTLLPDNQDWQVTHVGRFRNCSVHLEAGWERVLWFPFDRRGCGKRTYQRNPRAIPLRWGLFSSPGTLPGSCHCPGWSGSRQRPCFFTNETRIMTQVFLEEMEGCHLFLSSPFVMHSGIRGCTKTFRRAAKMASRWSCRRVFGIPSGLDSSVQVSTPSGGLSPWHFKGCSFSSGSQPQFLFLAVLPSSLGSCPFSHESQALFSFLGTFVARLRWAARRSSLCSLAFDIFENLEKWQLFLPFLRGGTKIAPEKSHPDVVSTRATDILRESSALLASRLRTSSSPTRNPCHRYTPRKLSASRLPAPHQFLPDQESVPQIYSAKAQRFSPPGSAPVPPRPGIRATDILRESSALLASRLRTSSSPTRNPCHRYTPRKLSASRLPAPHQFLPDQESVPQIYSAKAQRFSPPGSAPVPPRPGIRATDILRESSALRASLLRTSPSPTRNPCHRYTPR